MMKARDFGLTAAALTLAAALTPAATGAVAQAGAAVRAMPLVPLHSLVTMDDYPAAARRYDQQGRTSVLLSVDRTGRVSGCAVATSSGSPALDAATCQVFASRAQFAPARDASGRTVADSYAASIRWALPPAPADDPGGAAPATPPTPRMPIERHISFQDYPDAALRAGQQGRVAVRLGVSAAGRVTDCTVTTSSRSSILDATTCRLLRSRVRFDPARDRQGVAVAGQFETFVVWSLPDTRARPTA